jgi:membrane fusion protein, adhesin transport system
MQENDFIQDCYVNSYNRTSQLYGVIIKTMLGLLVLITLWASFTTIPLSKTAPAEIQYLEKSHKIEISTPKAVSKILVSSGSMVKKGDPLVEFKTDELHRDYNSNLTKIAHLDGSISRLKAQAYDEKEPKFPEYMIKEYPKLVDAQLKQFNATTYIIKTTLASLKKKHSLTNKELENIKPLVAEGIVPEIKADQIRLKINDIELKLSTALKKHEEESLEEYNEDKERQNEIIQQNKRISFEIKNSILKAPISGLVKNITAISIGEFVYPTEALMEIIPPTSRLITTAYLQPSDRGFINVNQPVSIKIDAYDSSLYGDLKGKIIKITTDAEFNEEKGKKLYKLTIASDKDYIQHGNQKLTITPGMSAFAHIKTTEVSLLTYLFQPVLRSLYTQ